MTDYISRADAIEAVAKLNRYDVDERNRLRVYTPFHGTEAQTFIDVVDLYQALEALPSADAVHGEWNTGKPTKGGKYIVTLIGICNYRFVEIMHYDKPCMPNIEVSGACWYRDDDEWGDVVYDDKDIIAWIPLPTPYKGGDDE